MGLTKESLRIILRTYSKGGFNEDEAVQLIKDLFSNNNYITPYWPQITYTESEIDKFRVTYSTKTL